MSIHEDQKVMTAGKDLEEAERAVIMIHGRGASAGSVLRLSENLPEAAYLAPQAAKRTWYPHSFMEPREKNQPHLDSALEKVDSTIKKVKEFLPKEKIVLLGFSQGACLTSEYAAKNPESYRGLIIFSGGLIGEKIGDFEGDLENTPVFIGCSEKDPHIPLERVNQTEEVFTDLNAGVKKTIYEGSQHTINQDEISEARKIIEENWNEN